MRYVVISGVSFSASEEVLALIDRLKQAITSHKAAVEKSGHYAGDADFSLWREAERISLQ